MLQRSLQSSAIVARLGAAHMTARTTTTSRNSNNGRSHNRNNNNNKRTYSGFSHDHTHTGEGAGRSQWAKFGAAKLAVGGAALLTGALVLGGAVLADEKVADWDAIREEIVALLDDPNYDDGSYGPVLVRLAWHASGTYDKNTNTGGSNGATMRFTPEASHGANAGLEVARALLEPIKQRHPEISYADLWTFAGSVAIEEMGGPEIDWRAGRTDAETEADCAPDGRLPDAAQGRSHVRDVFYRQGFNDQEIVALIGAHSMGRTHANRSGYDGPWTKAPTMFSNSFFTELLENTWTFRKWDGPEQYADKDGELMMLPADFAFIQDPDFRQWVEIYAADEERFFNDFAAAWKKLIENGVPAFTNEKKKGWWPF